MVWRQFWTRISAPDGLPLEDFPREGHGLGEPRHQVDKMKREYAFFAKTVLGVDVNEKQELVP